MPSIARKNNRYSNFAWQFIVEIFFTHRSYCPPSTNGVLGKTIDIAYFLSKQGKPNELVISEPACSQAKEFESVETAGQHEISMPADNVSFMAYILGNGFAEKMSKVRLQCSHILGEKLHLRNR